MTLSPRWRAWKDAFQGKLWPFVEQVWRILRPGPLKIGLVMTMLSLVAMFSHYRLPKGQGAPVDWIAVVERNLYDARFKLRGMRPVSGEVGVLAADEASIAKFGRWPFKRDVYGKALANLKKRGVHWVGFDAFFPEQERTGLEDALPTLEDAIGKSLSEKGFDNETFSHALQTLLEASPGDQDFGKALSRFGNIVQGYFYFENDVHGLPYDWNANFQTLKPSEIVFTSFPTGRSLADYPELISRHAVTNTRTIAGSESIQGFVNNQSDPDGIARSATLIKAIAPVDADGKPAGDAILVPSLALQLAARYLKREILVSFDIVGVSAIQLMDPRGEAEPIHVPITLDGTGRMLINHYGEEMTFPHISLADAFDDKLPAKLPKVLVFGGVATGINDLRPSPFSELFNGVEHHTALIENILSESFMARPVSAFFIEVGVLVATGVVFTLLLKYATAVTSAVLIVLFSLGLFLVDKAFLFGQGQWFYIGLIYMQNFGIFIVVTLYKYFTEEREKKKIRNAFQHYLNPSVINQMMDNPDNLKLGGAKKELTVFFSDVRGFTTISETLSPEALTALLNEYFTPMTDIILRSGGLLDKYMGDAIMAVWGAPLDLDDHADRALTSSLLMLDALDVLRTRWKERGLPLIDIGIGLNTGFMSVGNMGSDQRFDYTVLGDAVNLGSRLEGINKLYGTRIICSEFTKARLRSPQSFLLRELDNIQVKGKTEPVKIFEVMRVQQEHRARAQELIQTFEAGLVLYRTQHWAKAETLFRDVLKMRPDDGPSQEFLDRCLYLAEHSPGERWDGTYVAKSK